MSAKEYYRTGKHSEWAPSEMRQRLLKYIIGRDPKCVFEFGCAGGENLEILMNLGIPVYGIDINPEEVEKAKERLGTIHAEILCGDEDTINDYVKDAFPISFTCGVLDHIPEEDFYKVLVQLEKVTKNWLYCCETNDTPTDFYYSHDYHSAGFQALDTFETNGGTYRIWRKKC